MEVTRSAVHRLEVKFSCGCKAVGEYQDAACKMAVGNPSYQPCEKHKDPVIAESFMPALLEVLAKEAKDTVVAAPVTPRPATSVPEYVASDAVQEAASSAPARTVRSSGSSGHRPPGAGGGGKAQPGSHRPSGSSSSTAAGVRRATGPQRLSSHAEAALAGQKFAAVEMEDISFDTVPEDPRMSSLLERSGLLDDAEEEADFEE